MVLQEHTMYFLCCTLDLLWSCNFIIELWHVISNNMVFWQVLRYRRVCTASYKLRKLKWGSVSSLTVIEYLSCQERLWSVCAYAQAGLSLCWSHIPCWKSHATAQLIWTYLVDENSVDPDQLASTEASWSGSTLFSIKGLEVWKMYVHSVIQ